MSVNELADKWNQSHRGLVGDESIADDVLVDCADDLNRIARTAWHPVSDPPTEGHSVDMVLTWREGWTAAKLDRVGNVRQMARQGSGHGLYWAHQRDVVLLPPQSTTGEG